MIDFAAWIINTLFKFYNAACVHNPYVLANYKKNGLTEPAAASSVAKHLQLSEKEKHKWGLLTMCLLQLWALGIPSNSTKPQILQCQDVHLQTACGISTATYDSKNKTREYINKSRINSLVSASLL